MRIEAAEVMEVLQAVAPVEWAGLGLGSPDQPAVPFVVWRYEDEPAWFSDALQAALTEHAGRVEWVVEKPGRNWVLLTEREKAEFASGSWRTDSEYRAHVAATDPGFCELAMDDLHGLLGGMAKAIAVYSGRQD
jgi:hypothetical protein